MAVHHPLHLKQRRERGCAARCMRGLGQRQSVAAHDRQQPRQVKRRGGEVDVVVQHDDVVVRRRRHDRGRQEALEEPPLHLAVRPHGHDVVVGRPRHGRPVRVVVQAQQDVDGAADGRDAGQQQLHVGRRERLCAAAGEYRDDDPGRAGLGRGGWGGAQHGGQATQRQRGARLKHRVRPPRAACRVCRRRHGCWTHRGGTDRVPRERWR